MPRKRELTLGAGILVIATLAFILGWTNLFVVKSVSVMGSPNADVTTQVLQIANIKADEKLARIEPRSISARLKRFDWVESAKVTRNWLTRKVVIDLKAREAVAASGAQYVDKSGAIFTSPTPIKDKLFDLVASDTEARRAAVTFYLSLPAEIGSKVASVQASDSNNFRLINKDGLKVIWGGNSDSALKYKIYKALLALPENSKIKLMDLSDPTKPIVK